MGIFGRWVARQRLRRAARQSLLIPAFSPPLDCTPWVVGGLWPAELSEVDPQISALAEHLNADLQRIVTSTNERLGKLRRADMTVPARQAEEARVIKLARESAVLRVESTVRHMRNNAPAIRTRNLYPAARTTAPRREVPTEVLVATPPEQPTEKLVATPAQEVITDKLGPIRAPQMPAEEPMPKHAAGDVERRPADPGSGQDRLRRLLTYVARQQPELRWAVGDRADGATILVTDLAHGWIPPGIVLPAAVRLLEPGQRSGNLAALLGPTTASVMYTPGDRLGGATDFDPIESSLRPRELPMIDDLGWLLGEATHWRDGLPRLAHTLAKAGAAGTGVVDAEMDLLRVNLDTMRYQLLTQYPDVDAALLFNCLLLAATEGIAAGDTVSANYHFAWFRALSARRPAAGT